MRCRAVIIGEDHANTLSLIRALGRNKIPFIVIFQSEDRHLCVNSRYVKKNYIFVEQSQKAIIETLRKIRKKTEQKPVVLCATDLAQYTVDYYLNELEQDFYCFNFSHEEKKICKLMDKYEQYLFACRHGIAMAQTWKVKLEEPVCLPENIEYPVIIKPSISAFGEKKDIERADDENSLRQVISDLIEKGYAEAVIQKFIQKNYEVTALGGIFSKNTENALLLLKKIHIYPTIGGSMSYAKNMVSIPKEVSHVIEILQEEGYEGLYDIEFFCVDGGYMLNEINFRSSGVNYVLESRGISAAYQWYLQCNGGDIAGMKKRAHKIKYNFEIYRELCLLQRKEIRFGTFIKEFLKASSYSMFAWDDMMPLFKVIMNVDLIRERFGRNR